MRLPLRLLVSLSLMVAAVAAVAAEPRDISAVLEPIRAQYKLPACASAVMENGQLTAIGATGLRRADQPIHVTTSDSWHIGSCTKSMTAVLAGVLVDAGKLRWDMPISEAFAGVPCHPAWRKITLWDLVTQRSGLGAINRDSWDLRSAKSPGEQRDRFARGILQHSPGDPPGNFAYSNAGYGLLGALLEHVSGESYEDLLRTHLFQPLQLKTAGFGAPGSLYKLDEPWGHWRRDDRLTPVDPVPENQFPPALAPAACVHMSLVDFARYAAWLTNNEPPLVTPSTFKQLQTPPSGSSYAGGLWQSVLPGIGGEAVCHTGHLGGFFAVFYAGRTTACVSVFNTEGGGWEWLGDEICAAALKASR